MNNYRKAEAQRRRNEAAQIAHDRPHPRHKSNGDEHRFRHTEETANCHHEEHKKKYSKEIKAKAKKTISLKGKSSYLLSFTKGLPHFKYRSIL